MKGNIHANPPGVKPLSEREKRLISLLFRDGAFAEGGLSKNEAAGILSRAYPMDNNGTRNGHTIKLFIESTRILTVI